MATEVAPPTMQDKLNEVKEIMDVLQADTNEKILTEEERVAFLENLHIYGRDRSLGGPMVTKEGIETLIKQSFDYASVTTSREAQRCLSNALLLNDPARQIFVDLGGPEKAAERLKNKNTDDEFLMSRLLFLVTYGTVFKFNGLFEKHGLGDSVNSNVARHSKQFPKGGKDIQLPQSEEIALTESLKLMFNVSVHPGCAQYFRPSVPYLASFICATKLDKHPLQGLMPFLLNPLLNQDVGSMSSGDSEVGETVPSPLEFACRLIDILDEAVKAPLPSQCGLAAVSLLGLLMKLYESAPEDTQKHMRTSLLPDQSNRDRPIGQDDTLPSRLLKMSLAPEPPKVGPAISTLMFALSGNDSSKFVENVGYGFAAGFLMRHNIAIPESVKEAQDSSKGRVPVNPITGQRLDAEPQDTGPEMTEEEKEREAERLFVLFERLNATGVVNVTNPVRAAREAGRFEELE